MRHLRYEDLELVNLILSRDPLLAKDLAERLAKVERALCIEAPPPPVAPGHVPLQAAPGSAAAALAGQAAPELDTSQPAQEPVPASQTKAWEVKIVDYLRSKPEGLKVAVGTLKKDLKVDGQVKTFNVALHNLLTRKVIKHNGQKGTGSAYWMLWKDVVK